jgi:hypothetical protein
VLTFLSSIGDTSAEIFSNNCVKNGSISLVCEVVASGCYHFALKLFAVVKLPIAIIDLVFLWRLRFCVGIRVCMVGCRAL